MNKTYNYKIEKTRGSYYCCTSYLGHSTTEKLLKLFSYILNLIYDFVTDEAVVLLSKLTVVIASFVGIFIMMGISVCGIISFFPAFMIALALLAVILLTFKSM